METLTRPKSNHHADQLVTATPVKMSTSFDAARAANDFFHQSAVALQRQFSLSKADARAIVAACPDCARLTPIQDGGVNPQGLQPRQLWQTDGTEFPQSGRLKHIHVSVDTCSAAIWATASTSTNAKSTQ